MTYYKITDNQSQNGEKPKLVLAKTKAAALSIIVDPRYSVVVATQEDLIELSAAGVKVIEKQ